MGRFFRRALVLFAVALAVLISVGGGGTYVMMQVTTRPQFCRSCHNMVPYYESWASSSHSNVGCVDCHYEPGLLETFEGKFKALSQLAKYVTATEGTKPWAEVSDYSCMRSGCHSERLLEGEIQFGALGKSHQFLQELVRHDGMRERGQRENGNLLERLSCEFPARQAVAPKPLNGRDPRQLFDLDLLLKV